MCIAFGSFDEGLADNRIISISSNNKNLGYAKDNIFNLGSTIIGDHNQIHSV